MKSKAFTSNFPDVFFGGSSDISPSTLTPQKRQTLKNVSDVVTHKSFEVGLVKKNRLNDGIV